MPINELTLAELTALMHRIATIVSAGNALQAGGLGPVFDLTPGAPITIYTNAVMPATDEGVNLTPLAADIVSRTSARDLTRCGPELSAQLSKDREDFGALMGLGVSRPEHVDIPSFLKRESTEAPPTSPASEPVDPPPALGEVVGGGPVAAEPKRNSAIELWTAEEDATLLDAMVELMVGAGMARKPAATKAAERLPGRSADACIYRIHTKLKEPLAARLTAAASVQAETETPEIPEVTKVDPDQRDAAAGAHSPAAVQEIAPEALDQAFDRQVDAMPDLHGDDLRVWQWVAANRAKWPHTAGTDLDLAVGLGRGEKLNLIALDLGIDVPKLQERWDCLSRPIQNGQGKITIDGMPRLINILRRIAKAPAAAA